ncbi:hypothetical protein L2164_01260 [Pectobacterium brasiliense]|uniref:hypothetical protein n=1 Tax=Pectobacterium brasiliense TaxID=180957 RepID=UPI00069AAEDE|nr:hypothetical protein [Pectobacterium brasiliense]MCG5047324.1 hypothetical protein [Pectobacterium brasiliense]
MISKEELQAMANDDPELACTPSEVEMARYILELQKQEPYTYVLVDGEDIEFNASNKFSCGRRGGQPLYAAPVVPNDYFGKSGANYIECGFSDPSGFKVFVRPTPQFVPNEIPQTPDEDAENELMEQLFTLRSSAIASGDDNVSAWDDLVCAVFRHFKSRKHGNHDTPALNGGNE